MQSEVLKMAQTLATLAFRGFTSCIKTSELSQQRAGGENYARGGVGMDIMKFFIDIKIISRFV
jgi:hypothetical protein